jgi:hypothetical protein
MKILKKIYDKSNGILLIISSVLFVIFMATVLPYVSYWTEVVKELPAGPDTLFTWNINEYYSVRSTFGEEGRRLYIILRWTFDVVWPMVYTFFYFIAISFLAKKTKDSIGYKWLLIPVFAVVFDFAENTMATIFMAMFPSSSDVVVRLLIVSSNAKWAFVGLSFVVIIYLGIKWVVKSLAK